MTNDKVYILEVRCDSQFDFDDFTVFSSYDKAYNAGEEFINTTDKSLNPEYYISDHIVE